MLLIDILWDNMDMGPDNKEKKPGLADIRFARRPLFKALGGLAAARLGVVRAQEVPQEISSLEPLSEEPITPVEVESLQIVPGENPELSEALRGFALHYESPRGIITLDNPLEGNKGFRPTSPEAYNELASYLTQVGVRKLVIQHNPELDLKEGYSFLSICPNNSDPRCDTPFLYFKWLINNRQGTTGMEYMFSNYNLPFTTVETDYLNGAFQRGVISHAIALLKFGKVESELNNAEQINQAREIKFRIEDFNAINFVLPVSV